MGLLTEFPILICDLASGMDAIIGTDVLGLVLPHTLDIKNFLLFTDWGCLTAVASEGCRAFRLTVSRFIGGVSVVFWTTMGCGLMSVAMTFS